MIEDNSTSLTPKTKRSKGYDKRQQKHIFLLTDLMNYVIYKTIYWTQNIKNKTYFTMIAQRLCGGQGEVCNDNLQKKMKRIRMKEN